MSDEKGTDVIEIPAKEPAAAPARETMTREEMQAKGWSDKEIESASKREMISSPEDKKKKEEESAAKAKVDQEAATAGAEKKAQEMAEAAKRGDLPDFTMTPTQEKVFLETFGPGTAPRAMYFRMKNERQSRQRAEQERDRALLEAQMLKDESERRARVERGEEQELDANGNPVDPDDKPLTMRQIKEIQRAEAERQQKAKREFDERAGKVAQALNDQEEYAKAVYADFEPTVHLAKDLVDHPEKLTDPLKRARLVSLIRNLRDTAGNADKYSVDEYTASMIAYELGQMHPDYGKPSDNKGKGNGDQSPKGNGALTAEQMERMKENTQRRSSASLPGRNGGTRTLAPEDVKVKDLLDMPAEQRFKFKKDHPDLYKRLMRG